MQNKHPIFSIVVLSLMLSACVSVQNNDPDAKAASELKLAAQPGESEVPASDQPEPKKTMNEPTSNPSEDNLNFKNRTVVMETNFGTLNIIMLDKAAPKTTENFIRLTSRGYFDGIAFHRMVESPNFKIIQGGDPKGNGTGGESAWGRPFEDETHKKDNPSELVDTSLYADFDGRVTTYKKGLIAMANSGPNTNGSQFFVMLGETKLPPNYTIFGQIDSADFPVLDKILTEVDPPASGDGRPSKEIKIVKATLK